MKTESINSYASSKSQSEQSDSTRSTNSFKSPSNVWTPLPYSDTRNRLHPFHSVWNAELVDHPDNEWNDPIRSYHSLTPPPLTQKEPNLYAKTADSILFTKANDVQPLDRDYDFILSSPRTPDLHHLSPPVQAHANAFPHQTINISPHTILSPGVINASGQGNASAEPHRIPRDHPSRHSYEWIRDLDERERNVAFREHRLELANVDYKDWVTNNRNHFDEQQRYLKDQRSRSSKIETCLQDQIEVIYDMHQKLQEDEQKVKDMSTNARRDVDYLLKVLHDIRNEYASFTPVPATVSTAMDTILDQFTFIIESVSLKHSSKTGFYLFRLLSPSIERILDVVKSHAMHIPELDNFGPSFSHTQRLDHLVGRLIQSLSLTAFKRAPGDPSYFELPHPFKHSNALLTKGDLGEPHDNDMKE